MRKYIISTIIAVIAPHVAICAPIISGVSSGEVANSSTIVISGTFPAKGQATPWLYDDFESGAVAGNPVDGRTSPIGGHVWHNYNMGGGGGFRLYDATTSYSGSVSATENSAGNSNGLWVGGQATQSRYLSYRFRYSGAPTGSFVWKFDRTTSGLPQGNSNPPYDAYPNFGWGVTSSPGTAMYYNNGNGLILNQYQYAFQMPMPSENTWHRGEMWLTMSNPKGAANGYYQAWLDGIKNTRSSATGTGDGDIVTCDTNIPTCMIDTWITPIMANSTSPLQTWIDDIYIDNTQARVEICTGSTWSGRGTCEIQIPTDWSTSSISVTANQGSFASDTSLYIYAVDDNGNASPGYPVMFVDGSTTGICGLSNGLALSTAPVTGLCSAGTPSAVTGTGPWSWTCAGSSGGSTASCGATLLDVPSGGTSAAVACSAIAGFR